MRGGGGPGTGGAFLPPHSCRPEAARAERGAWGLKSRVGRKRFLPVVFAKAEEPGLGWYSAPTPCARKTWDLQLCKLEERSAVPPKWYAPWRNWGDAAAAFLPAFDPQNHSSFPLCAIVRTMVRVWGRDGARCSRPADDRPAAQSPEPRTTEMIPALGAPCWNGGRDRAKGCVSFALKRPVLGFLESLNRYFLLRNIKCWFLKRIVDLAWKYQVFSGLSA